MSNWKECRNILCIRADNMGDILMSTPALQALKQSFHCKITLLTSCAGAPIVPLIKFIDEVIVQDLPWSQNKNPADANTLQCLIETLKNRQFDGAIIFTVYSQNPLPSVMLAYMAEIPLRLAYCRENPYQLLTDWIPDEEPFSFIQHQVKRDLRLVASIGAHVDHLNDLLSITYDQKLNVEQLNKFGIGISEYLLFHPGVSEEKRTFPKHIWIELGRLIQEQLGIPIILTGSTAEKQLTDEIAAEIGYGAFSMAGSLGLDAWVNTIGHAQLVVSVNTATIHIAAATQTPVVVLYALTNPQHTPWKVPTKILPFSVKETLKSKNVIVRYVSENKMPSDQLIPTAEEIFLAVKQLLHSKEDVFEKSTSTLQML